MQRIATIERRDDSPVLNLAQAAKYMGISKTQLLSLIHGRFEHCPPFPVARAGERILIRKAWIDDWLEECKDRMLVAPHPGKAKRVADLSQESPRS